jgi:hypothetical protein
MAEYECISIFRRTTEFLCRWSFPRGPFVLIGGIEIILSQSFGVHLQFIQLLYRSASEPFIAADQVYLICDTRPKAAPNIATLVSISKDQPPKLLLYIVGMCRGCARRVVGRASRRLSCRGNASRIRPSIRFFQLTTQVSHEILKRS